MTIVVRGWFADLERGHRWSQYVAWYIQVGSWRWGGWFPSLIGKYVVERRKK